MKYTLDWSEYAKKAREAVAEGCVLIKNEDNALPIKDKAKVANPFWGGTAKAAVEPAADDLVNRRHASFLLC